MPGSPFPKASSFHRDEPRIVASQQRIGLKGSTRSMGFAEVMVVQIETKPFHLGVHIASETDCFTDMLMKVFPELSIEVIDREKRIPAGTRHA